MSEAVYFEVYEATTGATGLRQLTVQVDPSVPENTTISHRSASNQLTTYYNSLKVDQLISNAVSNAIGSGGAFTVVTTMQELIDALESTLVLDIYCKRVELAFGSYETATAIITSSKNIYGGDGDLHLSGAYSNFYLKFPESGGIDNITVSFYGPITKDSGSTANMKPSGGYSGSPEYTVRYTYLGSIPGWANISIEYERAQFLPDPIFTQLKMWSGRSSFGNIQDGVTSISSEANGVLAINRRTRYDIIPYPYDTNGDPYLDRIVSTDAPLSGLNNKIMRERIESSPLFPYDDRFKGLFENSSIPAFMYNEYGQMSLGVSIYPWDSTYKFVETVGGAFYYDSDTGKIGICYGGYYDGGWRYKEDGVRLILEEWDGYDKKTYESTASDTPVAGDYATGGLLPARYDQTELKYNYEFDSTITGATATNEIRGNNATFISSTNLFINDTDLNGLNRQSVWFNVASGDKLVVHSGNDWGVFSVTSASWTPNTATIVGTFTKVVGLSNPTDGDNLIIELVV